MVVEEKLANKLLLLFITQALGIFWIGLALLSIDFKIGYLDEYQG